jgi:hypothetical protein
MAKKEMKPVDLTLLDKTVAALKAALAMAESKKEGDVNDYILELDKAIGLLSGVVTEATMLIGDVSRLAQLGASPSPEGGLGGILGGKGGGGIFGGSN